MYEIGSHQLAETTGLLKEGPIVYTIGYRLHDVEASLRLLTKQGYPIIDIRERAGSRFNPAYNRRQLESRFQRLYYRVPALGNINHQIIGAPIAFVDLEAGLEESTRIIQQGKGAILLCACAGWETCHRTEAARHLLKRIEGLTIVHIGRNGLLTTERAASALQEKE